MKHAMIESLEARQLFSAGLASSAVAAVPAKATVAVPMFKRPIVLTATYTGTSTAKGSAPSQMTITINYQRRSSLRGTVHLVTSNNVKIDWQFSGTWDVDRNINFVFVGGADGTATGKFSRDLKTIDCTYRVTIQSVFYKGSFSVTAP